MRYGGSRERKRVNNAVWKLRNPEKVKASNARYYRSHDGKRRADAKAIRLAKREADKLAKRDAFLQSAGQNVPLP